MSREGLGGPQQGLGGVRRPSWRNGRDREEWKGSGVPPENREDKEPFLVGRDGLGGPSGGPGGIARDGRGQESTQEDCEDSEALPEGQAGLEGPPSGLGSFSEHRKESGWTGVVGSPTQRARSYQKALLEGWEWSRGTGGVRRPFGRARRSREGWESLGGFPEVRDGSGGMEESGGLPRESGWVGRPARISGRSWEALPESQDRLEGSREGLGGVRRPFQRSGRIRADQVRLGGPPVGTGGVRTPSWRVGRGWEPIPKAEGRVTRPFQRPGRPF